MYRLVAHATLVELQRRHDQPFLEDLRGGLRQASRDDTADVLHVSEFLHPGDQAAVDKHREGQAQIGQMPDASLGLVRMVPEKDVAGVDLIRSPTLEDGIDVRGERDRCDGTPGGIEDGRHVIVRFADVGRACRALDLGLDLPHGRFEHTLDDLEGGRGERFVAVVICHSGTVATS